MNFTYWEGEKIPYIELCFETIKKYCPEIIRLNEKTAGNYIDLPPEYYKIKSINHRVDYLKAHLIYKYGGFWIDADTILLKQLPLDMIKKGYFGCPGLFGAPKEDKKLKVWVDCLEKKIKEKSEFRWAELIMPIISQEGETYRIVNIEQWRQYNNGINPYWKNDMIVCIEDDLAENGIKYGAIHKAKLNNEADIFIDEIKNIDVKMIHPWFGTDNLNFIKQEEKTIVPEQTFAVILYNKVFPDWFKKLSREEILKSNYRISNLLKMAL